VLLDYTAQNPTWRQFDPYGNARGAATTWIDNRSFLDKTTDAVTGLTNIGARYYDPSIGRFISLDPILESTDSLALNGYGYTSDNPVTESDPTGQRPCNGSAAQCGNGDASGGNGTGQGTAISKPVVTKSKSKGTSNSSNTSGTSSGRSGDCNSFLSMCMLDSAFQLGSSLLGSDSQCPIPGCYSIPNFSSYITDGINWVNQHLTVGLQGCIVALCASATYQDGYVTTAWGLNLPWLSRTKEVTNAAGEEETVPLDDTEMFKQLLGFGVDVGYNSQTPPNQANQDVEGCLYDGVGGCVSAWPGQGGNVGASISMGEGWMVFGEMNSHTWKIF
jgi:RHS repeat-associated protein